MTINSKFPMLTIFVISISGYSEFIVFVMASFVAVITSHSNHDQKEIYPSAIMPLKKRTQNNYFTNQNDFGNLDIKK